MKVCFAKAGSSLWLLGYIALLSRKDQLIKDCSDDEMFLYSCSIGQRHCHSSFQLGNIWVEFCNLLNASAVYCLC